MPVEYFASMYAKDPDPWGFDTRWYERRKLELAIAALPRATYRRGFEPGCANGTLTERLALRCEELVALELMSSVASRARTRLAPAPHVSILVGALPEDWPTGSFDLVVLSEVLYYLDDSELEQCMEKLRSSLAPDGHVLGVHWLGETNYPLSGRAVHDALDRATFLRRHVQHEEADFVLGVYERRPS